MYDPVLCDSLPLGATVVQEVEKSFSNQKVTVSSFSRYAK